MVRIPIEVNEKDYKYFKKRKDKLRMSWKQYFFLADSHVNLKEKKRFDGKRR